MTTPILYCSILGGQNSVAKAAVLAAKALPIITVPAVPFHTKAAQHLVMTQHLCSRQHYDAAQTHVTQARWAQAALLGFVVAICGCKLPQQQRGLPLALVALAAEQANDWLQCTFLQHLHPTQSS